MPAVRVLHLVGSPTDTFFADLSVLYARDCLASVSGLDGYEHHVAYVAPDGSWSFPDDLDPVSLARAEPMGLGRAVSVIERIGARIAVPQMFCRAGMTDYRSLLDVLGLPYVGNAPDVMAIGADKQRARAIVAAHGVPVPRGEVIRARGETSVPLPVVVKPVDADNSVGVTLVRESRLLAGALDTALSESYAALVEEYVPLGREVRCGVLDLDGGLEVLPLEEYTVDEDRKPIRTAQDKLRRGTDGALSLVAKDPTYARIVDTRDPISDEVACVARLCHEALGCRDYSLFDFRIDPTGAVWFLEAGLYCSFAPTSVVAAMARAAGASTTALFERAVQYVLYGRLRRHRP